MPLTSTGAAQDWSHEQRIGDLRSVFSTSPRPAPLAPEALPGLIGEIIETIAPHTEADSAAVVASLLAMFGNAVGIGPHVRIEESRHAPCLYVCIVGGSANGRKGTSGDIARALVRDADPEWERRIADGLVSGEGLIHAVRNGRQPPANADRQDHEAADEGMKDKRLFVLESEFARLLAAVKRPDNTLSMVLRALWDRGSAQTLSKNSPERTTGAHVSLLAHITPFELHRRLEANEIANGFANRFLFITSTRSKSLPRGGRVPEHERRRLVNELSSALRHARRADEMHMTESAWALWESVYEELMLEHPGALGDVLARGPAQVRRLSMIYALLDSQVAVSVEHLRAGLGLWRYAACSARYIFGERLGDPLADRLLRELRDASEDGLTRDDIRQLVGHRLSAANIADALELLGRCGLAVHRRGPSTGGRRPERWYAVAYAPAHGGRNVTAEAAQWG